MGASVRLRAINNPAFAHAMARDDLGCCSSFDESSTRYRQQSIYLPLAAIAINTQSCLCVSNVAILAPLAELQYHVLFRSKSLATANERKPQVWHRPMALQCPRLLAPYRHTASFNAATYIPLHPHARTFKHTPTS